MNFVKQIKISDQHDFDFKDPDLNHPQTTVGRKIIFELLNSPPEGHAH
jgi:hypothetical protein